MPTQKRLEYLCPNTAITLREGIQELRKAEGVESDAVENVSPDLIDVLDVHDAIHVLFACPTNLTGEIIAHVWKVFGTTMKMKDMHRVNMHEDHRKVLMEIGYGKLIRTWFKSIPYIVATLLRSCRMKQRWSAEDYGSFLDTPLVELRRQFGVRLPRQNLTSSGQSQNVGAAVRHIRSRTQLARESV